jgi:hypothetical protein
MKLDIEDVHRNTRHLKDYLKDQIKASIKKSKVNGLSRIFDLDPNDIKRVDSLKAGSDPDLERSLSVGGKNVLEKQMLNRNKKLLR